MTIPHSMNLREYGWFIDRASFAARTAMTYEHSMRPNDPAPIIISVADVCSMIGNGKFRRRTLTVKEVADAAKQRIKSGAIDLGVVDRANILDPGFGGMIPIKGKTDERHGMLIDGGHRCVRAYQEGATFDIYELDVLRTACCMIPPNFYRIANMAMLTIGDSGEDVILAFADKMTKATGHVYERPSQ